MNLSTNRFSTNRGTKPLALEAVHIVKTNSELKDLWEEGDATKWRNVVADLELRLSAR